MATNERPDRAEASHTDNALCFIRLTVGRLVRWGGLSATGAMRQPD
jgi:hypothetical protein